MRCTIRAGVLAAAITVGMTAQAQPVARIITGASPGSAMDTLARAIAEPMGGLIGRTIIVETKPGAAYNIAADFVAKAPADGNTMLLTFNVHAIAGLFGQPIPFDPVRDFRAVGLIGSVPYLVIANPGLPGANLKEMIALAKAQKRAPAFASIGAGTPHHLMMEGVKGQSAADFRIVHYKGGPAAQTDVVAGHVDFTLLTPTSIIENQVKAKQLKVIAVTSVKRLPEYPDTPTTAEMGYQGIINNGWYAMLLPARTPAAVVRTHNEALNKVLAMPAIENRLKGIGATPMPSTPEALDQQIRADAVMWKKIVTENKITLD